MGWQGSKTEQQQQYGQTTSKQRQNMGKKKRGRKDRRKEEFVEATNMFLDHFFCLTKFY